MKITIAAVGKMKSGPEKELVGYYVKRTPWNITIKEVEEKKRLAGGALKMAEGKLLLSAIPGNAKKIVLDENGILLSSEALAKKLKDFSAHGPISFIIGGALGHADEMRVRADLLFSFGRLTWPHMLVRAMLAEQLYRAHTILSGHPYHKA